MTLVKELFLNENAEITVASVEEASAVRREVQAYVDAISTKSETPTVEASILKSSMTLKLSLSSTTEEFTEEELKSLCSSAGTTVESIDAFIKGKLNEGHADIISSKCSRGDRQNGAENEDCAKNLVNDSLHFFIHPFNNFTFRFSLTKNGCCVICKMKENHKRKKRNSAPRLQGSEFPVIIMPVHELQGTSLSKNLVYTALTRAKKMVVLVGSKEALKSGLYRETTIERESSKILSFSYPISRINPTSPLNTSKS